MLSFTVRLRFEEGTTRIAEMLRQLTHGSRQEPGCVNYIAHFVVEDPATVLIYEQYADEAALEHHRNTPHFQQYAARRALQAKTHAADGISDRGCVGGFGLRFGFARTRTRRTPVPATARIRHSCEICFDSMRAIRTTIRYVYGAALHAASYLPAPCAGVGRSALTVLAVPALAKGPHPKRNDEYRHQVEKMEETWRMAQLDGDVDGDGQAAFGRLRRHHHERAGGDEDAAIGPDPQSKHRADPDRTGRCEGEADRHRRPSSLRWLRWTAPATGLRCMGPIATPGLFAASLRERGGLRSFEATRVGHLRASPPDGRSQ